MQSLNLVLVLACVVFFQLCQQHRNHLQIIAFVMVNRVTAKPLRDIAACFEVLIPLLYALGKVSERAKQRAMSADVLDIAWLDDMYVGCFVRNGVPLKPYFKTTELETVVSWCEKHRGNITADDTVYEALEPFASVASRLYEA